MTREAFIEVLEEKRYSYVIEGDKIVITRKGNVYLNSLETLPTEVEFRNITNVYLNSLETLPPGVGFKNGGNVYLNSLETLSPGVEFNNGGYVYLDLLIGGLFRNWSGNIEGISSNRILNLMVKKGLFI